MKKFILFIATIMLTSSMQAQCPSDDPAFTLQMSVGDNGICGAKLAWLSSANGACDGCEGSWEINGVEVYDHPCSQIGPLSDGPGIYTITHYVGENSSTITLEIFDDCSYEIIEIDNPEAPCTLGYGLVDYDCTYMQNLPWSYSCTDTYQDLSPMF